ncbi:MAG: sigma-54 factor interaction domain-containing protein [Proteobacteria bacterium]|nr:sigma-54 factor interaction domain-containing protein [Pseudomonadota bacterium]
MRDKVGLVAKADLLILEEIGDIPHYVQAKLLTFLEDRKFRRLGDNEEKEVIEKGTAMLKVVEEESAIRRYQRQFVRAFRPLAEETIPVNLGHPGASVRARVSWFEPSGDLVLLQENRHAPLLARLRGRPAGRRRQYPDHLRDQLSPLRHRPADRRRLRRGPRRTGFRRPPGKAGRREKGDRKVAVRKPLPGGVGRSWMTAGRPRRSPSSGRSTPRASPGRSPSSSGRLPGSNRRLSPAPPRSKSVSKNPACVKNSPAPAIGT